jgi:hypothetical protein
MIYICGVLNNIWEISLKKREVLDYLTVTKAAERLLRQSQTGASALRE